MRISMLKKILSVTVVFLFSTGLVFGGGWKDDDGKLTVGTAAGFPPFEYLDSGEITGFDIDLITEIAKEMKLEVEIKNMSFETLIDALETGDIEVIASGFSITEKRAERVDFTDEYYSVNQAVFTRKNSDITIDSDSALNKSDYIIGVQKNSTGESWIEEKASLPIVKRYSQYKDALLDLDRRYLDMIILDKPVGTVFAKDNDIKIIYTIKKNEKYGLAVKKESPLRNVLNKKLADLKESDTWSELLNKYFKGIK